MKIDKHLLIVCGPSGAGKTTLARNLMQLRPNVVESVSHTTRPMREGEVDGVDYHFVDRSEWGSIDFIEQAQVHGHLYGTSREALYELVRAGRDIVSVVDWQGVQGLLGAFPDATVALVLAPSFKELGDRLRRRGDSTETINERLSVARQQLSKMVQLADHFVVNNNEELATYHLVAVHGSQSSHRTR
jgi:guanylate kinase